MEERKLKIALAFLAGIIVGGALTLFLTPVSGPELRRKIKDELEEAADKVKEGTQTLKSKAEEIAAKAKEIIEVKKEALKEALEKSKETIQEKKEELASKLFKKEEEV